MFQSLSTTAPCALQKGSLELIDRQCHQQLFFFSFLFLFSKLERNTNYSFVNLLSLTRVWRSANVFSFAVASGTFNMKTCLLPLPLPTFMNTRFFVPVAFCWTSDFAMALSWGKQKRMRQKNKKKGRYVVLKDNEMGWKKMEQNWIYLYISTLHYSFV